ncbi:DNA binding methylated-DNA--cysteine S-methyltransferase [Chytriomyces sp. MP71]|nr:DNA binding methylated-DNA--cysteine S-methyltransferase [Chytriomyces sp. MP71]
MTVNVKTPVGYTVVRSATIGPVCVVATEAGLVSCMGFSSSSGDAEVETWLNVVLKRIADQVDLFHVALGDEPNAGTLTDEAAVSTTATATTTNAAKVLKNYLNCVDYSANNKAQEQEPQITALHAFPIDWAFVSRFKGVAPDSLQMKVWKHMRSIDAKLCDYSAVAKAAGSPTAIRAAATAVGHNPVPLFVPCHRVIGKDGKMRGFSFAGGLAVKRILLKMETGKVFIK